MKYYTLFEFKLFKIDFAEAVMKKCISLILSIAVLLSVVPFTVIEPSAASGRIYEDIEYSMYCSSAGTWNVKTFVPEEDGIYIFSSSGSLDTLGYIALAEGEAENQYIKADGGQDNNFAVTYNMKAGTTYYLGSTVLMGPSNFSLPDSKVSSSMFMNSR